MHGTRSFDKKIYMLETGDTNNFLETFKKNEFLLCCPFTEPAVYFSRLRKQEKSGAYITVSSCLIQMFRISLWNYRSDFLDFFHIETRLYGNIFQKVLGQNSVANSFLSIVLSCQSVLSASMTDSIHLCL